MYQYEVKIPKERIAVLIGTKGKDKRKIESLTKTQLEIDSKEGIVRIKGEDNVVLYTLQQIIKAIGRGFNPNIAISLLNEENCLEMLSIQDYTGKNKKKLQRTKARIIGTHGKCRRIIEGLTKTDISIYGKTVSIIGEIENVAIARKALQDILSGAPHAPVYKTLQEKMKELTKL